MWVISPVNFKVVFSPNLKFFVVYQNDKLMLYRDRTLLWIKKVREFPCEVTNIANNGSFIVKYPEGVYLYTVEGEERLLNPILKEGNISQVYITMRGDKLFFERHKKPTGFVSWLAKDKLSQEIGLINISSGQEGILYSITETKDMLAEVKPAFGLKYVLLHDKKEGKLKLISLSTFKIEFELELKGVQLITSEITADGSVLMWLQDESRSSMFIRFHSGSNIRVPLPQRNWELVSFGKNYLLYKQILEGNLIMVNLRGEQMYNIPINNLERMNMHTWAIVFPNEEDILIIYYKGTRIPPSIGYFNAITFQTEVNRWKLELERRMTQRTEVLQLSSSVTEESPYIHEETSKELESILVMDQTYKEEQDISVEESKQRVKEALKKMGLKDKEIATAFTKAEQQLEQLRKKRTWIDQIVEEIEASGVKVGTKPHEVSIPERAVAEKRRKKLREIEFSISSEAETVETKANQGVEVNIRRSSRSIGKRKKIDISKLLEEQVPAIKSPEPQKLKVIELDIPIKGGTERQDTLPKTTDKSVTEPEPAEELTVKEGQPKTSSTELRQRKRKQVTSKRRRMELLELKRKLRNKLEQLRLKRKLGEISEQEYKAEIAKLKEQLSALSKT